MSLLAQNTMIRTLKAGRSVTKQGHHQPHFFIFKGQGTEDTTVKWPISDIFKGLIKKI